MDDLATRTLNSRAAGIPWRHIAATEGIEVHALVEHVARQTALAAEIARHETDTTHRRHEGYQVPLSDHSRPSPIASPPLAKK